MKKELTKELILRKSGKQRSPTTDPVAYVFDYSVQ